MHRAGGDKPELSREVSAAASGQLRPGAGEAAGGSRTLGRRRCQPFPVHSGRPGSRSGCRRVEGLRRRQRDHPEAVDPEPEQTGG